MKTVYIITMSYKDLENHSDELASDFAYESKEKALEKALSLSNDNYLYKYNVIEMIVEKKEGGGQ